MAEQDAGGIGVRFTADASQLEQKLQSLEQRLKQFNERHGASRVKLQADLVMPGQRNVDDFRRGIQTMLGGGRSGAGRVKARVELMAPTSADLKAFRTSIGTVKVKVTGDFAWGVKPPTKITVQVEQQGTATPASGKKVAQAGDAAPRSDRELAAQRTANRRAQEQRRRDERAQIAQNQREPTAAGPPVALPPSRPTAQPTQRLAAQPPARRQRASQIDTTATWTQADFDGMTTAALRDQMRGARTKAREAERATIQAEIDRRTIAGTLHSNRYGSGQGGPRGFINEFAASGVRVPRISETGVKPLSSARIRSMQNAGQLPLPYADAGLYDPRQTRASFGVKTMPPEADIRRRTRQAIALTPPERTESGNQWWPQSAKLIAGMGQGTGLKGPQMAGVAAMGTNALDWPATVRVIDTVFSRLRDGVRDIEGLFGGTQMTGRDRTKAMAIIQSGGGEEEVERILRGPTGKQAPKVTEMYRGWMGHQNALPMDRHFQGLTAGGEIPTSQIPRVRDIVANELQRAGRQPAGGMAGMWETIGGGAPFGPDPWGQLSARVPQRTRPAMAADPAGRPTAGGPRAYGREDEDPYTTNLRNEQRQSMRRANDARRSYQDMSAPDPHSGRVGQRPSDEEAAANVARLDEALFGRRIERAGPEQQFKRIEPADQPAATTADPTPAPPAHPRMTRFERTQLAARSASGSMASEMPPAAAAEPIAPAHPYMTRFERSQLAGAQPAANQPPAARVPADTNSGRVAASAPAQALPPPNPRVLMGANPKGLGWEHGDVPRRLEDEAIRDRQIRAMQDRLRPEWGGFTMDPKSGQFMEKDPNRRQGPWVSGVGNTVRMPSSAIEDTGQVAAAVRQLKADPHNRQLLEQGGQIGGFHSPERGEVDLDVSMVDQTASAAMRRQRERGADARGAYNVANGNGLFAEGNVYGEPETKIPGAGRGRFVDSGRFASHRDMAAAMATPLAQPGGVDTSDLDVPTYLRKAGSVMGEEVGQEVASAMAADPGLQAALESGEPRRPIAAESGVGPSAGLQDTLSSGPGGRASAGGDGGGGEGPRRPVAAGDGDDIVGEPQMSDALKRQLGIGGTSRRGREIGGLMEQGRIQIAENRGAGQIRAAGTTMASSIGTIFGGRGRQQVIAAEMTSLVTEMGKVQKSGESAFKALDEAEDAWAEGHRQNKPASEMSALRSELERTQKAAQPFNNRMGEIQKRFGELGGQSGKLRGALVGITSSIVGTMGGLALFQGASQAVGLVIGETTKGIDALQGYQHANEAVAGSLGDLTRQHAGHAKIAVATRIAQSGMGSAVADSISPMLEQRAAIDAGNKAFSEQVDLFRTARGAEFDSGGGMPGISQGTGGVLGTPLGATTPLFEKVFQQASPSDDNWIQKQVRELSEFATIGIGPGNISPGEFLERNDSGPKGLEARLTGDTVTDADAAALATFSDTLSSLNAAVERANPTLAKTVEIYSVMGSKDPRDLQAVQDTVANMRAAGVPEPQVREIERNQTVVRDRRTGRAVSAEQSEDFYQSALRGAAMPTREQRMGQYALNTSAQLQNAAWQGGVQRNTLIPGQQFVGQLASGRVDGQGNQLRRGSVIPSGITDRFGIDTSGLIDTQDKLTASANRGRDALREMIGAADVELSKVSGPSDLLGQFDSLASSISGTASQIRALNRESQQLQLGVQIRQIDESIRLTGQSLADAQSFISGAPSAGPGGGALGVLQNQARGLEVEQAGIGFESARLSQGMTQRQINFQRGAAAFMAPGATGEERAARIAENNFAADIAQKQLDLAVRSTDVSEEQFGVGQQMIDVQAVRNVENLNEQLGILKQQAQVQIQVSVNAEAAEALQEQMSAQVEELQSIISESYNVINTFAAQATAETAAVGGFMTEHMNTLYEEYEEFLEGVTERAEVGTPGPRPTGARSSGNGIPTYSPGYGTGGGGGTGSTGTTSRNATGYMGTVSGATQMTVGEAGPETIAILRNPRSMTMGSPGGSGGGGVTVNLTVTGNNIGNAEGSIEEFAGLIARRVEETLSRRSSLLGTRIPV